MEAFNTLFETDLFLLLAKVFFLVSSFLFTIFLVVLLKQVFSMNTFVHDANDSFILKLAAFILLISSLSLFLTALVIL